MSYTKMQISNFLNDNILFKFWISDDFIIKLNEDNNTYTFDEIENIIKKNLDYWNSIKKISSNSFQYEWQDLSNKIKSIRTYFYEIENLDLDNVNNYIYNNLSSNRQLIEQGKTIYLLSISSPIDKDEEIRKIKNFVTYYINKTENNLTDAVKNFIYLSKNINYIGHYLSNPNQYYFYPALFLLKKDFSKIKENISDFENNIVIPLSKKLEAISQNSDEMFSEITALVETKHSKISQKFNQTVLKIEEFQNSVNDWQDDKNNQLNNLEKTYKEKLSLEAPEQLWNSLAKDYRNRAGIWTCIFIVAVVLLILASVQLVLAIHNYSMAVIKEIPFISESFIFVSVISFFIYIIRILIKIVMSNHHLAVEYKQKASLTRFYQALIKSGTNIDKEERLIIINSLFSRVDTGLVKTDTSNDNDSIWAILSKNLK